MKAAEQLPRFIDLLRAELEKVVEANADPLGRISVPKPELRMAIGQAFNEALGQLNAELLKALKEPAQP